MAPQTQPLVVVIVLNWNGRDLTLDCLDSLLAVQTRAAAMSVLVVDNASNDDSVEATRARYGDAVEILVTPENLGFAGGNNAGIEHALARGADYVLLLNNDTLVAPDLIDHLLAPFALDAATGVTDPMIYYAEPRDQIWFAGGEISPARGIARHIGIRERDRGQYDAPRDVDYVTGCALMTSRVLIDRIGSLDPGYRAYFEDADFCTRARRAGYSLPSTSSVIWGTAPSYGSGKTNDTSSCRLPALTNVWATCTSAT